MLFVAMFNIGNNTDLLLTDYSSVWSKPIWPCGVWNNWPHSRTSSSVCQGNKRCKGNTTISKGSEVSYSKLHVNGYSEKKESCFTISSPLMQWDSVTATMNIIDHGRVPL